MQKNARRLPTLPNAPWNTSFPGGTISTSARVLAILAGTAGFAFDPTNSPTLFQDTAGATPVTVAADPVGRVNGFWGSSPLNFQQATAGSRPAWDGTDLIYDGPADHFPTLSSLALLAAKPGAFFCEKVLFSSLTATQTLIGLSTATVGNARYVLDVTTAGAVRLSLRRLDADAVSTITSANGVVTTATSYIISGEADYAGTGLGRIWVNGALVASGAISGVVGNTEAVNSGRFRKGAALSGSVFLSGKTRRGVLTPFVLSAADRAYVETWVGGV